MSRRIDVTRKLTDEEVAYLKARDHQRTLDLNALYLMGGGADEDAVEAAIQDEVKTDEPAAPDADETGTTEDVPEVEVAQEAAPEPEAEPEAKSKRSRK